MTKFLTMCLLSITPIALSHGMQQENFNDTLTNLQKNKELKKQPEKLYQAYKELAKRVPNPLTDQEITVIETNYPLLANKNNAISTLIKSKLGQQVNQQVAQNYQIEEQVQQYQEEAVNYQLAQDKQQLIQGNRAKNTELILYKTNADLGNLELTKEQKGALMIAQSNPNLDITIDKNKIFIGGQELITLQSEPEAQTFLVSAKALLGQMSMGMLTNFVNNSKIFYTSENRAIIQRLLQYSPAQLEIILLPNQTILKCDTQSFQTKNFGEAIMFKIAHQFIHGYLELAPPQLLQSSSNQEIVSNLEQLTQFKDQQAEIQFITQKERESEQKKIQELQLENKQLQNKLQLNTNINIDFDISGSIIDNISKMNRNISFSLFKETIDKIFTEKRLELNNKILLLEKQYQTTEKQMKEKNLLLLQDLIQNLENKLNCQINDERKNTALKNPPSYLYSLKPFTNSFVQNKQKVESFQKYIQTSGKELIKPKFLGLIKPMITNKNNVNVFDAEERIEETFNKIFDNLYVLNEIIFNLKALEHDQNDLEPPNNLEQLYRWHTGMIPEIEKISKEEEEKKRNQNMNSDAQLEYLKTDAKTQFIELKNSQKLQISVENFKIMNILEFPYLIFIFITDSPGLMWTQFEKEYTQNWSNLLMELSSRDLKLVYGYLCKNGLANSGLTKEIVQNIEINRFEIDQNQKRTGSKTILELRSDRKLSKKIDTIKKILNSLPYFYKQTEEFKNIENCINQIIKENGGEIQNNNQQKEKKEEEITLNLKKTQENIFKELKIKQQTQPVKNQVPLAFNLLIQNQGNIQSPPPLNLLIQNRDNINYPPPLNLLQQNRDNINCPPPLNLLQQNQSNNQSPALDLIQDTKDQDAAHLEAIQNYRIITRERSLKRIDDQLQKQKISEEEANKLKKQAEEAYG